MPVRLTVPACVGVCVFVLRFCHCFQTPLIEIICPGNIQLGSISGFPLTGPAMDVAVEELQKTYSDKFRVVLTYLYNKSLFTCDDLVSGMDYLLSEYYMRKKLIANATVFVFPGCSEGLGTSKLASGWNQFVMIGSFSTSSIRNKTLFPNVIQASPLNPRSTIQAYVSFLQRSNWTTVYVVTDTAGQAGPFSADISKLTVIKLRSIPGMIVYYMLINTAKNDTFDVALRDIKKLARIVCFWGQASVLRRFILTAAEFNMTNGDYVYIAIGPFEYPILAFGNITWQNFDNFDEAAFRAYRSVFIITPTPADKESRKNRDRLSAEFVRRSRRDYNFTYKENDLPSPIVTSGYANVKMFGTVMDEILTENPSVDLSHTTFIAQRFFNRTITTIVGQFYFDEVGDRITQYELQQLNTSTGSYSTVLLQDVHTLEFIEVIPIEWVNGHVPLDTPECGFSGVSGPCSIIKGQMEFLTLTISVVVCVTILFLGGGLILRKAALEIKLQNHYWDLKGAIQLADDDDKTTTSATPQEDLRTVQMTSSQPAVYEKLPVLVTTVATSTEFVMRVPRNFLRLAKALQELDHPNLNRFVGIARKPQRLCFVYDECQRGSLNKMLCSPQILSLEWDAKLSLIDDLLEGIKAIHNSYFKFHGNLSSYACLISKHFALKITDLGVSRLLAEGFAIQPSIVRNLESEGSQYLAPELADSSNKEVFGTIAGDVYSIAILSYEIAAESLINAQTQTSLGPDPADSQALIYAADFPPNFKGMLLKCVDSVATTRPTLKQVLAALGNKKVHGGFVAKLLTRLSNYAVDMEYAVFQRTQQLLQERQKCDDLLSRMLPTIIIDRLRRLETVQPEEFDCVTIQFSDMVGFVDYVTQSSAFDVFTFLNNSHGLFDQTVSSFDVYKVETIADSYVLASGLPVRNGTKHAEEICKTAIALQNIFQKSSAAMVSGMLLRIGVHSGPCVAAVVGLRNPRYCLFGDTMNTASRMESHGEGGKIHLSPLTMELISKITELRCLPRGPIEIKGKGLINTFWIEY